MQNEGYCYECEYMGKDGKCLRSGKVTDAICNSFILTQSALAKRYLSAKHYAKKIGMVYDASGIIFAGYPRNVRRLIKYFEKLEEKSNV